MSSIDPGLPIFRLAKQKSSARTIAEILCDRGHIDMNRKSLSASYANDDLCECTTEDSEAWLRILVESIPDPIWVHVDGEIVFINRAALRLFGAETADQLLGTQFFDRIPEAFRDQWRQYRGEVVAEPAETHPMLLPVQRIDGLGTEVEVVNTAVSFKSRAATLMVAHDITERRKYEAVLQHQATHDTLTGLPNRVLLFDRLTHAISRAERRGNQLSVMFVDLDKFKYINDTLGHATGDELLKTVAHRLSKCVRESDTIARLGGDEFVLLIDGVSGEIPPAIVAKRVACVLAEPMSLSGQEHTLTSSIGISKYPEDGDQAEVLLQRADIAMYRAKETGGNTFQFFTRDMQQRLDERIELEHLLQRALQRDEFVLHYQPQVDLRSGRIVGLEALIRWESPVLGLVPPMRFIPIAEESNLILDIGQWVLEKACAQIKDWSDAGVPVVPVAVNVAASQFSNQRMDRLVLNALQACHLEEKYLELELTESLSMDNPETTIAIMRRLKEIGVLLSIDDFGTGYSNLSYLKRFPVDKLKIDQSFIRGLTLDPEDRSITTAVIRLAHSLGLKAIAEGVETQGQACLLAADGCDEMQGYYFSMPVPAAQVHHMLLGNICLNLGEINRTPYHRTILIVDDDRDVLESLKRILRGQSLELFTAQGTEQACEILAKQEVGVVVSDQNMPGESGIRFFSRIKQLYPNTIRILMTGNDSPEILSSAINKGEIYKFICKPWDNNQFREAVQEAFLRYENLSKTLTV